MYVTSCHLSLGVERIQVAAGACLIFACNVQPSQIKAKGGEKAEVSCCWVTVVPAALNGQDDGQHR
jgi:hypothetical protein